ncbi:hypothetical protein GGR52DRAFT_532088 [Hypoxylon sp. FL1284]|nr:hypothetical protein GGR52DRAFT_532088 [Hypoxylon sp. FL1284]
MAPGQNTFSVVPEPPCAINANAGQDTSQSRPVIRPMTTKQARKEYLKRHKGPKLSKAEQRRQDLFEQDRIRKEFEKEKNQARARAARDKKREKEEKDRAERRKKGLPLVDVRPSQDTIAWFVRGDRRKQETWTASPASAAAEDSDSGTPVVEADADAEPPPKKQKTELPVPENEESSEPEQRPSSAGILQSAAGAPDSGEATGEAAGEAPADDNGLAKGHPTSEKPSLELDNLELVEQLLDASDNIPSSHPNNSDAARDGKLLPKEQDVHAPNRSSSPRSPDDHPCPPTSPKEPLREQTAEDSTSLSAVRQPLQTLVKNEVNMRRNNKPVEPSPEPTKKTTPAENPIPDPKMQAPRRSQPHASAPPPFRHPITPMGPPRLPPKFKAPNHASASRPVTPQFLVKQPHAPRFESASSPFARPPIGPTPQGGGGEQPPTSTQAFMFNHLDDFFPSPSQEVREVFGDVKPSIVNVDRHLTSKHTHSARPNRGQSPPSNPTPDVLNANRADPKHNESRPELGLARKLSTYQSRNTASLLVADTQFSDNSETSCVPFFSTQDFFLSSQDIKDIEDETPSKANSTRHPTQARRPSLKKSSPALPEATRSESAAARPVKKSELDSGTKLIDAHDSPPQLRASGTSNKGGVGLMVARVDVMTPNRREEQPHISSGDLGDETRLVEKLGNRAPNVTNGRGSLQTKGHVTQPRASPKPFFDSSCGEARYKYAIERYKTTKWEDSAARQKAQQQLEHLRKLEDERLNSLLYETITTEGGNSRSSANSASGSKAPADPIPRPHSQPKSQPQPQTVNQLSKPSQKRAEPNQDRQRRNRTRSPYEVMLEELEVLNRKEKQKQEQQQQQQAPAVPASQETDYGDDGLDDVLYEML